MFKYKIIFCEATSGKILNENGKYFQRNLECKMYNPEFDNIQDALLCKDNLLEKFPYGEVCIINNEETLVFTNKKWIEFYLQEKLAINKWASLPFFIRWFTKKPNCTTEYNPYNN